MHLPWSRHPGHVKRITIAIDGYSSCGKSTLAKQLAHHLHYTYIDSGAMYRAVALYAMENGLVKDDVIDTTNLLRVLPNIHIAFKHDDATQRSATMLDGRNVEHRIREMDVSNNVTLVSPVPEVRAKLVQLQQEMGQGGGVVMDGRDIGTVVFPNAEVKFFMTASTEVRAQRRYLELKGRGAEVTLEEVKANLERRDLDDTTREADPLVQAEDAFVIDNSHLTSAEQFDLALGHVVKAIGVVTEA
ncbi:MAG: (d)CMP kinase [Flavobacteriales bacterium]